MNIGVVAARRGEVAQRPMVDCVTTAASHDSSAAEGSTKDEHELERVLKLWLPFRKARTNATWRLIVFPFV
jgi:hypothetical protein